MPYRDIYHDNSYYKDATEDTLRDFLMKVIKSAILTDYAWFTLPSKNLPLEKMLALFKVVKISFQKDTGMSILTQQIPLEKNDRNEYVSYCLDFRDRP